MIKNSLRLTGKHIVLLISLFSVWPCQAGQVLAARAEYRDDHYLLHLDMRLQAQYPDVLRTLLDFPHLPKINDAIKSATVLSQKGNVYRVKLIAEGCIWIFCRRVKQLTTVTVRDDGYITSDTDTKHSDLRYGRELWHIVKEGKTTRVQYNADVIPSFWIPPLIGPALFKHQLLKEGKKTINGIEQLIQRQSTTH